MITKNYIKMCVKAKEIQKLFQFRQGDLYIHQGHYIYLDESIASVAIINQYKEEKAIWLPTQEQLQEMVKGMSFHIWGYFDSLTMSASTGNRDGHMVCKKVNSFNELWLTFVMKEKYNKVWNGREWQ